MEMIQVGLIGVLGMLFAIQFKMGHIEYGMYISIVVCGLLCTCLIGRMEELMQMINQLGRWIHLDSQYIHLFLKMIGISYVAELSASICKDAGYHAIALQIEMFGKITLLTMSIPVLYTLLKTLQEFIG